MSERTFGLTAIGTRAGYREVRKTIVKAEDAARAKETGRRVLFICLGYRVRHWLDCTELMPATTKSEDTYLAGMPRDVK